MFFTGYQCVHLFLNDFVNGFDCLGMVLGAGFEIITFYMVPNDFEWLFKEFLKFLKPSGWRAMAASPEDRALGAFAQRLETVEEAEGAGPGEPDPIEDEAEAAATATE